MPDVLVRQKGEVRIARAKGVKIGVIRRGERRRYRSPACEDLRLRATAERASHDHASL